MFQHQHAEWIAAQIDSRYSPTQAEKYKRFIAPTRNPLRRVADLLSVTYLRPPRLTTPEKVEIAEQVLEACPDLYLSLAYIENATNGIADIIAMPYYEESEDRIYVDAIPPHIVDIKRKRCSVEELRIKDFKDKDLDRIWRRLKSGEWVWADVSTKKTRGRKAGPIWRPTGLGKIPPFVWYSIDPVRSIEEWSAYKILDLVNGTIQIGEIEAFHDSTNLLKSFRQPYAKNGEDIMAARDTGEDADGPGDLTIGYDNVIMGELGALELADPNDPFMATIQNMEADLAASRGISRGSYFQISQGKEQASTITEELRQRSKQQIKIFRFFEGQLHPILIALLNKYRGRNYDPHTRLAIDYFSPEEANDPKYSLEVLKSRIELGVGKRTEYVFKNNPEMRTHAEAVEYCDEADAEREIWMERMAKRNSPKDPTDPAQDPATNGAQGKGAAGPMNPNSVKYQQDENDARSAQPAITGA